MKAIVFVLILCLAVVAVPATVEADTRTCDTGDVECVAECLAHDAIDPRGDHACGIRSRA